MLKIQLMKYSAAVITSALLVSGTTGCRQLPGSDEAQGAAVGGVGGAIAGAAVAGDGNRLLGALIGGALGAGGGYLIGANADKITGKDRDSAERAVRRAQTDPATPVQAKNASSADVNNDGFVTMDEVVALEQAGFDDQAMIERLRSTGQVFELTSEQEQHLRSQGVTQNVIDEMEDMNREQRERLLNQSGPVISQPPVQ